MADPAPDQLILRASNIPASEMDAEEELYETQSELELPLFSTTPSVYPGDSTNTFDQYEDDDDEYEGEVDKEEDAENEEGEEEDDEEEEEEEEETEEQDEDEDGEDDDDEEESEAYSDISDHWELPPMAHQITRHTTTAGFGEIFHTTTKPIYSKMNLNKLVQAAGAGRELPQLKQAASLTITEKNDQFERTYGKLKEVEKAEKTKDKSGVVGSISTPPPPPANLIDVMNSNFSKTIVKTYLYRMVLVGTHKEDQEAFIDWMKDAVEDINMHCYSETLTGVFIMYPYHFVHVIEGSEDTLMKYVRYIADQFEPTGNDWKLEVRGGHTTVRRPIIFTTVKAMVIGIFQIRQRGISNGWKVERAGSGLTMTADQVPPGDFRERLFQFARATIICAIALFKLPPLRPPPGITYNPGEPLPPPKKKRNRKKDKPENLTSLTESGSGIPLIKGAVSSSAAADIEAKERFDDQRRRRAASISQLVPKPAMIDYIMRKNEKRKIQLRTVREHLDYFWKIPKVVLDQQNEWPIQGRIAPYD